MEYPEIAPELSALLSKVDTPTVCNAIEVAEGKRGFNQYTRRTVMPADPALPAFFGYAKTARISAINPPAEPGKTVKARRMAYYRYISEPPAPRTVVIEDIDHEQAVGAYWGEVNTTVHKGLGVSGALTNGLMRDLGDLAPDFQVLAGGVGPSHAFAHVIEIDTAVTVFGLTVSPGDFVHADRHGAVIVPPEIILRLQDAIAKMQAGEQLVLGPAREPGFDFTRFEKAWDAFEKART